jgi:hypothetical protein
MADRYWVGGTGNWSDTNRWSATSGGGSGASVPTSADNVIFDASSNVGTGAFTVTVDGNTTTPSLCDNFSTGGAGGALDGAMTLALGTAGVLDVYGSFTLPATNFSVSGSTLTQMRFQATTTGKTITTNGVSLAGVTQIFFIGVGGGWTLGSALTTGSVYFHAGTFATANFTFNTNSLQRIANSGTTTLNLGSSSVSCAGTAPINFSVTTDFTFNAGTSTITCSSGVALTFTGGDFTFNNVSFTAGGVGVITLAGTNTFNNLTFTTRSATGVKSMVINADQTVSGTLTIGATNTAIRRFQIQSNTVGTQRTITLNGTLATLADVSFRDIVAAGTAGTWTGTRLGNAGNNSNITFVASKTVYWNLAGTQNWSATGWATTNNGTPAGSNFPLPQDIATFTQAGAAGTVTFDANWWVGSLQMADGVSNRTTAFTLATGTLLPTFYGDITLFSSLTLTGTGTLFFSGSGVTQNITSAGVQFPQAINFSGFNSTFKLIDNFTQTSATGFNHANGTVDLNNRTLTCYLWSSANTNTRSIAFGTGNITVTGNNGSMWTTGAGAGTGFSISGTPVVNFNYSGSTGTRNIAMNASGEANAISINITAGTDIVSLNTTGGSYKNIDLTGFSGSLSFGNSINIFGNFTLSTGLTLNSSTATIGFQATSGIQKVTSNGKTLECSIVVAAPGATFELQDNLTLNTTKVFTLSAGTLDLTKGGTTNLVLTTGAFTGNNSNVRSILFGTGNITVTGNSTTVWGFSNLTNFSYTGTPTVNLTYSGSTGTRSINHGATAGTASNAVDFNISAGSDSIGTSNPSAIRNVNFTGFSGVSALFANGFIYGNLTLSATQTVSANANATTFAATSGTKTITTNGVFIDRPLTFDGVGGTWAFQDALTQGSTQAFTITNGTVQLKNGVTSTVGSFVTSGTNQKFLQSTLAGSQATISQASGTVAATYLTIKDSNATGGAIWNAYLNDNNVNGGNNTGWNFNIPGNMFLMF